MSKSNPFVKNFKNINKIINSLLEENLNKLKFENLINLLKNNKIILTFVAFVVLFLSYLLLPTLYKQNDILKKLQLDFKGSTQSLQKYTKFGLGIPKVLLTKKLQLIDDYQWENIIDNQIPLYLEEIKELEKEYKMLDEGLLDLLKRRYNSIADAVAKIGQKIKQVTIALYKRIIKVFIDKAIELAKKGLNFLLDFLGIELTGEIEFR